MLPQRLLRLSTALRFAISTHLQRNIGSTAVLFNTTVDPIKKLYVDKIREFDSKSKKAGAPADAGPEYQKMMNDEIAKLQRLYGGGDLLAFPEFTFQEPKLEETGK
ncbi:ATP synthase-coupling factor 6, mitochondrial isoform X1 [Callorhinchus milii]|uniref:ATP synthase peripheral stalk subunit F6, mitochondrial n=1 Tax=Callorhinchus milii TaxID=7868 RepID=K4FUX5_CALMI|nr:ATP synthase-coupling factor 6, mitochondrial [Callorhinchus milii]XP_042189763.1 ATP synthase-coupling factor 6, mitochondrial isoform X1 [Callorhinchus milii]AFK11439.1 ATP synthase, H+ transporting, mitochondrial Fo complex, subunit F6 [Callorhinchus milii]|eukprot:gi/632980076/ref/XP_007906829.1/ PREDICTED: ATP synthase-coupling factor 6, mitochondrial [Callorhinchus milii]